MYSFLPELRLLENMRILRQIVASLLLKFCSDKSSSFVIGKGGAYGAMTRRKKGGLPDLCTGNLSVTPPPPPRNPCPNLSSPERRS